MIIFTGIAINSSGILFNYFRMVSHSINVTITFLVSGNTIRYNFQHNFYFEGLFLLCKVSLIVRVDGVRLQEQMCANAMYVLLYSQKVLPKMREKNNCEEVQNKIYVGFPLAYMENLQH